MKRSVTASLILLLLCLSALSQSQSSEALKSKVIGTVVARGFMSKLVLYTGQSQTRFRDDLLAKVEKGVGEINSGEYVRIIYEKSAAEKGALPELMFEKKQLWEFALKRDESCDSVMRDLMFYAIADDKGKCKVQQYMQWLPWGAEESVPLETKVKCYSFGEEDFRTQVASSR